jgi:hypothetical protein
MLIVTAGLIVYVFKSESKPEGVVAFAVSLTLTVSAAVEPVAPTPPLLQASVVAVLTGTRQMLEFAGGPTKRPLRVIV